MSVKDSIAVTTSRPPTVRSLARSAMLVSLAAAACASTPDFEDTESELTASYKARIKNRTLSIIGNTASSRLTLRLGASTTSLEVDVDDNGTAEFQFDRSMFERIAIDAGGGDDTVTIDERSVAFTTEEQVTIDGGKGDDTIIGGVGPETIFGGPGSDTIAGGFGADTIFLGAGDDTYLWEPGGASDVVEGGGGLDTLRFTTSGATEDLDLSAAGDRLRLTRDVGAVVMDLHALELVELHTRGGADRVAIHDLSQAHVAQVSVDLESSTTGQGDLMVDTVSIDTTATGDTVDIGVEGTAVVATGLFTEVWITNGEPALDQLIVNGDASDRVNINGSAAADTMSIVASASGPLYDGGGFNVLVAPSLLTTVTVNGLGGDDTITASTAVTTPLILDGGDGDDALYGGSGADRLYGGAGNDIVDGRLGADSAELGAGDDRYLWIPGGASDIVDGGADTDTLIFAASTANDSIDVRANGGRVRLYRDIATVTMDLGGIERFDVHARGGTDTVVVGPLTGTSATEVNVNLGGSPDTALGDGQADIVVLDGTPGVTTIEVAAEGDAVAATGLGAKVSVMKGDPQLDRMLVSGGVVNVNGTAAADTMIVTADASGPLFDGGGFNILVAPRGGAEVTVKGHGGDDWIGTSGSVTTPLILDGGDGIDTIYGGAGADRLLGGPGADLIDGQMGADTVLLGDGDDTYVWDPGDSSDSIDGQDGIDGLVFIASSASDTIDLRASGNRVTLSRNIGSTVTELGSIERIDVRARGGMDTVVVGDLTGTSVTLVDVELGASAEPQTADGQLDTVAVVGSLADDAIVITADAGELVVSGLAAAVRITCPDAFDQLQIYGGAGLDTISTGPGVDSLITVMTSPD